VAPGEIRFAPGDSPFHGKGTVWVGIRGFVEARVDGGVDKVVEALEDPALGAFFSQMFVTNGWYDIMPIMRISQVIGEVMGVGQMEYVRQSATWHADQDLKGVYKLLGKLPSPIAVCRRFASMSSQMWNFVNIEIVREDACKVESYATGIPQVLAPWWLRAAECYTNVVLKASGAKNGRVLWQRPQPDGSAHGMTLVRVPAVTAWDE
jgi:hypothetical protein